MASTEGGRVKQAGGERSPLKVLLTAACVVILFHGLQLGAPILVPLALAFFLAIVCLPFVHWLQERKAPYWLAVLLTILLACLALGCIAMMTMVLIQDFQEELPAYVRGLRDLAERWAESLRERGVKVPEEVLLNAFDVGAVLNIAGNIIQRLIKLLSNGFLVMIIMIFMLVESRSFPRKMQLAFRPDEGENNWVRQTMADVQRYLFLKTVISAATGLLAGFLTYIMGLDFPILWGLVAFAFNYIPTIGSIIAAIPPVLLALILNGPGAALAVMLGYLAINITLGNFVEPALFGQRLDLSIVVVILALVFWGAAWGIVGMFLAVPLAMFFKIMARHIPGLDWAAILMAKTPK